MKFYCTLLLGCVVNMGCVFQCDELSDTSLDMDIKNLPPLAVEYTTETTGDVTVNHLRMVRNTHVVEWLYLANNTGELWTKTSNDLWYYSKIFHTERQVIEYSPVDLELLNIHQQWQMFAINPGILHALTATKSAPDFQLLNSGLRGWQSTRYKGEINGTTYDVLWLPQLSLAARITAIRGKQKTVTEISKLYVGQEPAFTFTDLSRYRTIEYTDLGDMERDPFVLKIQHHLLDHHGHAH